ncbi:uncharacterized protein LOC122672350 [Telopea speciosissima]|uniref:uncharacterized protein LOC122672350 n=1 Tax=Telopea speciosissima TaxID=54955 RepID=UPI001CC7778D|nr:uncharacterized protein LOC122672350 [Telopea speciosissima]
MGPRLTFGKTAGLGTPPLPRPLDCQRTGFMTKRRKSQNPSRTPLGLYLRCVLCQRESEYLSYLFLDCDFTQSLWKKFMDIFGTHWSNVSSYEELIAWWILKSKVVPMPNAWSVGVVLIPFLNWGERNNRKFDARDRSLAASFLALLNLFKDVSISFKRQVSNSQDLICARTVHIPLIPKPAQVIREVWWCRPPLGWVKLNSDGCSLGNPGRVGAGGILHDDHAVPIGAFGIYLGVSNFLAEFWAILHGILLGKEKNVCRLWIESESAAVLKAIQTHLIPWKVQQLWLSLQPFLNSIQWKISHCFREANPVADFLAKLSAKGACSFVWNSDFLAPLNGWLLDDALGHQRFRFG